MGDRPLSSRDTLNKTATLSNTSRVYKILLIGDAGVGKSGLLLRFADDTFLESYNSTLGVEFKFRSVYINGSQVKLQIWDTSGQERFRAITANYYRNIHGIMIVYDVTNKQSFNSVSQWLEEVNRNSEEEVNKMVVGNKSDLEENRIVDRLFAEEYATHLGCTFYETSAKDDSNVDRAFMAIATDIHNRLGPQSEVTNKSESFKVTSNSTQTKSGKRCC